MKLQNMGQFLLKEKYTLAQY